MLIEWKKYAAFSFLAAPKKDIDEVDYLDPIVKSNLPETIHSSYRIGQMQDSIEILNGVGRKIQGSQMWEGFFKNDKLHGPGRLIVANKNKVYEGVFVNGWIQNK